MIFCSLYGFKKNLKSSFNFVIYLQVVVDNTNPEKKDRAEYIKLAKKYGVPVRCFKMSVDHAHALHNNKVLFIRT
jgi:hypothetical protein